MKTWSRLLAFAIVLAATFSSVDVKAELGPKGSNESSDAASSSQKRSEHNDVPSPLTSAPIAPSESYEITVLKVQSAHSGILVNIKDDLNNTIQSLSPRVLQLSAKDRPSLHDVRQGDNLDVTVDSGIDPKIITTVNTVTRPVGFGSEAMAVAISAFTLAALLCIFTSFRPWTLLIGVDNRYSNSQVQMALWFGAVATFYGAAFILRWRLLGPGFIGGIGMTGNVIALTGLSAFTFGGAKLITSQKESNAESDPGKVAAAAVAGTASTLTPSMDVKTMNTGKAALISNLMQNDHGDADLGDVQMILITLAAVGIFSLVSCQLLSNLPVSARMDLPEVDTSLLSLFGLGQGAYLLKKAALPVSRG